MDTGAQGNILPLRTFQAMCPNPTPGIVKESTAILTAYNGSEISQDGKLQLPCKYEDSPWTTESFYIANTDGPAILGLPSCRVLKMVTLHCAIETSQPLKIESTEDLVTKYPDQFDRIGHFQKKYHIVTDPDVPPVIHAPKKCPIYVRDELKKEIDEMIANDVIMKIDEPEWVSSLT